MDKIEINADRLLLVEGNDDQNLFQKLIEDIGLDGVQIISMNGKENFRAPNLKSIINTPGFREVKSLGIVQDADENANNTFSSICTILKECGLPVPAQPMGIISASLKVGVLIIPHGAAKGKIEDLCLAAIKEYNELECIENYFSCLRGKLSLDKFPKDLSKAKIQAFLASREESVPHLGLRPKEVFSRSTIIYLRILRYFLDYYRGRRTIRTVAKVTFATVGGLRAASGGAEREPVFCDVQKKSVWKKLIKNFFFSTGYDV